MTIIEAIKEILKDRTEGLTSEQIYQLIVERDLYHFGAMAPAAVVNNQIRKHCKGIEFPTAAKRKFFQIVRVEDKKHYYALLAEDSTAQITNIDTEASTDILPEERIKAAHEEHKKMIMEQLLEKVLANDAAFFERMVVDLLLKMGYGYDRDSGIVTGRPHDGGIDGIIKKDKLGLDSIYIQAKRYNAQHTVKGPDIQQFIGAMGKVSKGVFITTSSFTKSAKKHANDDPNKTISLIDGERLVALMLTHGAGVSETSSLSLYQIDEDYFN